LFAFKRVEACVQVWCYALLAKIGAFFKYHSIGVFLEFVLVDDLFVCFLLDLAKFDLFIRMLLQLGLALLRDPVA
jgi:hypothetical protein